MSSETYISFMHNEVLKYRVAYVLEGARLIQADDTHLETF